jgi:hypothetical protein
MLWSVFTMSNESALQERLRTFYVDAMKHPSLWFPNPSAMEACFVAMNHVVGGFIGSYDGNDTYFEFIRTHHGCKCNGFVESYRNACDGQLSEREVFHAFAAMWEAYLDSIEKVRRTPR